MAAAPKTIDQYLARLPVAQRAALEKLRKAIHAAAPEAEECISYQLPTFKQDGMLVSFGAWKDHCALYGLSAQLHRGFERELADYETSIGTIRFRPEAPLPATLVKKLVRARLAENAARAGARSKSKAAKSRASARSRTNADIVVFLRELEHPMKREIEAVRKQILAASRSIREELKWNAPSFATREHFATFHLRSKTGFQLVLHRGAKSVAPPKRLAVADPAHLLTWRATDRALVGFRDARDVARKLPALKALVREWIRHV